MRFTASPVSASGTLADALKRISPAVSHYLRGGFEGFSGLSSARMKLLQDAAVESLQTELAESEQDDLASKLGVADREVVQALLSSAGILAVTIVTRPEAPAAIVEAFIGKEILPAESRESALEFAGAIAADREKVRTPLEEARLGSEVLPSLLAFDATVDLRIELRGEEVARAVPVAIIHLDTDGERQEVWLQLTRKQVSGLAERLNHILKQMNTVEQWAKRG